MSLKFFMKESRKAFTKPEERKINGTHKASEKQEKQILNTTKIALEASLKELLKKKPFDKITIAD